MGRKITYAEIKRIGRRRSGRTKKIWGVVLVIIGLCMLSDIDTMSIIICALCVTGGLYLFFSAVRNKAKWNRYEALVNQYGNTPIPFLAEKMNKPESQVCSDLQEMINYNFFIGPGCDITAYINGELNTLVMTRDGRPLEPLNSGAAVKQAKAAAGAGDEAARIRKAIDMVTDDEVRVCLYNLESSVRKISGKLKASPELEDTANIRKLKSFYMPQTLLLIDKYTEGLASSETQEKIKAALATCSEAFENIQNKLSENDDINTQVDIEVLRRTFEREGLLGSDFEL